MPNKRGGGTRRSPSNKRYRSAGRSTTTQEQGQRIYSEIYTRIKGLRFRIDKLERLDLQVPAKLRTTLNIWSTKALMIGQHYHMQKGQRAKGL